MFDSEEQLAKGNSGKILVLEDAVKIHTMPKNNKETNVFEVSTCYLQTQLASSNLEVVAAFPWNQSAPEILRESSTKRVAERNPFGNASHQQIRCDSVTLFHRKSTKYDVPGSLTSRFPIAKARHRLNAHSPLSRLIKSSVVNANWKSVKPSDH